MEDKKAFTKSNLILDQHIHAHGTVRGSCTARQAFRQRFHSTRDLSSSSRIMSYDTPSPVPHGAVPAKAIIHIKLNHYLQVDQKIQPSSLVMHLGPQSRQKNHQV